MGQQNTRPNLFIKIIQGQTQSHQLYDFQNGGIQHEQQLIQPNSFIIKKQDNTLEYKVIKKIQYDQYSQKNTSRYKQKQINQTNNNNINDLNNGNYKQLPNINILQQIYQYQQSQLQNLNLLNITILYELIISPYKELTLKSVNNNNNNNNNKHNSQFFQQNQQIQQNEQKILWKVISPTQSYILKQNDIIKIGKIKIQFKKLVSVKNKIQMADDVTVKDQIENNQINNFNQNNYHQENYQHNNDNHSVNSGHSNCDRCRICFASYNIKSDPLVCLCNCSGSIKYVHFICLKDWISNSIAKRQDQHYKFYSYNQTFCQLCKSPLKPSFIHQSRNYSLFDFNTFSPPYAQFQYSQLQPNNKLKYYKYIINLQQNKQVIIGRNNSSQVVMKDISISRTHCSLEYNNGILILRDKGSKFGTLVKVKNNVRKQYERGENQYFNGVDEFFGENGVKFQYQSKLIQIYQKKRFKNCCCNQDAVYKIIYDAVNQQQQKENNHNHNHILNNNNNNNNNNLNNANQLINQNLIHNNNNNNNNNDIIFRQISSQSQLLYNNINEQQQSQSYLRNNTSARNTMIRQTQIISDSIRY